MHLRHLILNTLSFCLWCDEESNIISEALITDSSNFIKHNVINKAVDGLSWTKPAHFISATLIISNNIMPTTLTQTITCSKPSSSLPSNQKLKLNYYSLLLFKNPRRWTIHSSTKTLPSKQAICSMRCTVATQKKSCRPRRTRRKRVQGLSQITWLAS